MIREIALATYGDAFDEGAVADESQPFIDPRRAGISLFNIQADRADAEAAMREFSLG